MQNLQILRGGDLFLDLTRTPLVMGIINVNDDSFFAPSRVNSETGLLHKVQEMVDSGVDIIDIGAMSSRPGATLSDPEEEGAILRKSLSVVRKAFPDVFISVDTVWANVARIAVEEGGNMINDISAGAIDPLLWDVVAAHDLPYVVMHMRGVPETMQSNLHYEDVIMELMNFFAEKIRSLQGKGISQIILDPGFGFSKTLEANYKLLENLSVFQVFDYPILVGISRKSFIYKALKTEPEKVLMANSALHALALQKGAKILRVHDVMEAKQVITLFELLKKG